MKYILKQLTASKYRVFVRWNEHPSQKTQKIMKIRWHSLYIDRIHRHRFAFSASLAGSEGKGVTKSTLKSCGFSAEDVNLWSVSCSQYLVWQREMFGSFLRIISFWNCQLVRYNQCYLFFPIDWGFDEKSESLKGLFDCPSILKEHGCFQK